MRAKSTPDDPVVLSGGTGPQTVSSVVAARCVDGESVECVTVLPVKIPPQDFSVPAKPYFAELAQPQPDGVKAKLIGQDFTRTGFTTTWPATPNAPMQVADDDE